MNPRSIRVKSYSSIFLLALFSLVAASKEKGMKCSSHPAYESELKGVLIRSWSYTGRRFEMSNYIPRFDSYKFAPRSDLESTKYESLDLFVTGLPPNNKTKFVTLSFQRPAKIYLFVRCVARGFPKVSLPGWNSEGWAKLVNGDRKIPYKLGVHRKRDFKFSAFAYVFSKESVNDEAVLPGKTFISNKINGTKSNGEYWARIAEYDGTASEAPKMLAGIPEFNLGGRCPDELHELWTSEDRSEEPELNGKRFKTAHPLWDPCYWCAFDHEHGSIPLNFMNYYPRFGYVALKNNNQDESHNGFKAIMLRNEGKIFYYGFHAHLSRGRRFHARTHTVVFVVVKEDTKELLVELGHKGDFGFLAVRIKPRGITSVNDIDKVIRKELQRNKNKSRRLVNVINIDNLDPTYSYRTPKALKGRYEQWFTTPMCSKVNGGMFKVDFQQPNTALKEKGKENIVKLGTTNKSNIVTNQNNGILRTFKTNGITISAEHCGFKVPNSGYFFTDKNGTTLNNGPGPESIRQFIKPGFEFTLSKGKWRATDTWIGVHERVQKGKMVDVGAAVDPESN